MDVRPALPQPPLPRQEKEGKQKKQTVLTRFSSDFTRPVFATHVTRVHILSCLGGSEGVRIEFRGGRAHHPYSMRVSTSYHINITT